MAMVIGLSLFVVTISARLALPNKLYISPGHKTVTYVLGQSVTYVLTLYTPSRGEGITPLLSALRSPLLVFHEICLPNYKTTTKAFSAIENGIFQLNLVHC